MFDHIFFFFVKLLTFFSSEMDLTNIDGGFLNVVCS